MKINSLCLFLFIYIGVIYSSQLNLTLWQDGFDNLIWNKRLSSFIIRRVIDTNFYECVKECLTTTRCKSINYAKKFPVCELNYQTDETKFQEFKDEVGFVYGNIKHFDSEIAGLDCRKAACPINAKCQQRDSSTVTCEVSDCGIPEVVQGTTMTGTEQGIGIGHHRLYKCGTLEEISVCNDDGHWTYVQMTCSLEDICYSEGNGYIYDSKTNMCVKPYDKHVMYDEGRSTCTADGADLVILDTKNKHNFISNTFCHLDKFWLGLTDREQEGVFKWVDNSTTGVNPSWSQYDGIAFTKNEADCVRFVCGSISWMDTDCFTDNAIICEKRLSHHT